MTAILVVEDDGDIAALLRAALRDAGHRVVVIGDHARALAVLGAARFDLVLADAAWGPDDPWAGLEAIRAAAAPAPVAICSAHDPARFADHAARGFAALISKPFDLADLDVLVARLLAGGGPRDATLAPSTDQGTPVALPARGAAD